jgi:hypothetical protein
LESEQIVREQQLLLQQLDARDVVRITRGRHRHGTGLASAEAVATMLLQRLAPADDV